VAERLAQLGVGARAVEAGRLVGAAAGTTWVAAIGLDRLLSTDGLGRSTAAVLLVVRPGKTRRTAVADASALLRGSGVALPGILVV
jgi:Mrp family chromosome partitioning ATPase